MDPFIASPDSIIRNIVPLRPGDDKPVKRDTAKIIMMNIILIRPRPNTHPAVLLVPHEVPCDFIVDRTWPEAHGRIVLVHVVVCNSVSTRMRNDNRTMTIVRKYVISYDTINCVFKKDSLPSVFRNKIFCYKISEDPFQKSQ